ncbi:MAG TPA: hypothetical protein PLD51_03005 [Pontiellaceae bacterium]|nr:hypothetical protein [Pontiellaceae bacterium]
MRKAVMGITALLLATLQNGNAELVTTAQDYAVDSDVVLESAVREVKSIPQDTANMVGDAVKMVSDETATAVNGVKAVFRADPIEKNEKAAALEIADAWDSSNDVIFRSYKVSEAVGTELTTGKDAAPGTTVDVSGYFSGIQFPKGTSAMYRPEFKRLFVRQTLQNMLSIEDALAEQHNAKRELMGKQVEIQTKFIEVGQNTLNELGFNWTFDNLNGGDMKIAENLSLPAGQSIFGTGLRTAAGAVGAGTASDSLAFVKNGRLDWTLVIKALEQSDGTDVLSAPSITTRDGKTANIWVGEQRSVPKSFAAKQQNTSIYIEHSDFSSDLMGVQLEVTPELRKGGLIDLDLKPKVIDLVGYDNYQITPGNAQITRMAVGNTTIATNVPLPDLFGQLPYFRLREMTTKVTVADGSTVGMGGLIYDKKETYKDKVPVLGSIPLIGRLFRSEGEKTVKRNLMIFVTATEVDVNGRRAADLAMKK